MLSPVRRRLSVCNAGVHPTQPVEIFDNVSMPFETSTENITEIVQGNPLRREG